MTRTCQPYLHADRRWRTIRRFKGRGDGQDVEVQVAYHPAAFYRIVVHAGSNTVSNPLPGFTLETGSSMKPLALAIAKAVSEGMLGLSANRIDATRTTTGHVDALLQQARQEARYMDRDWAPERWTVANTREVVSHARRLARCFLALDRACLGGKLPSAGKVVPDAEV